MKVIHVDMDCFYAAIEIRDDPRLAGKPVAVGGVPGRGGVICTANYIARQFGVHAAMASFQAVARCPALIILPVNMEKYQTVAKQIRAIFYEYTDRVEPLSWDEAYLDVSASTHYQGSATRLAEAIRQSIFIKHQLTASAGVAPNKFLAKIASDWRKPNGLYTIAPAMVDQFMLSLPVAKIVGVGKVMAQKLAALQLHTCADLQRCSLAFLTQHWGKTGARLHALCRGIDDRPVETNAIRKSVSVEHTFPEDLHTLVSCVKAIDDSLIALEKRLARYNNRVISKQFIKIKFNDFHLTTVESTTTALSHDLFYTLIKTGLDRYRQPVRLLGLGVGFDEVAARDCQEKLDFF